jgi:hypothetical protein
MTGRRRARAAGWARLVSARHALGTLAVALVPALPSPVLLAQEQATQPAPVAAALGAMGEMVETVQMAQTRAAGTGRVRWLDKISGESADLRLGPGLAETRGRLTVVMSECRVPADNPASDAFAHLTVTDSRASVPVFTGWMIASSPALNALDHARYDVWLLGCDTEAGSGE